MKAIEVENLTKDFVVKKRATKENGKKYLFKKEKIVKHAVNDISFSVEEGEALAFIGPNGAGKSTTIKMLTGILFPTSGKVRVLGLDPSKDRIKLSYQIGSVFGQKEQLWIHLSAYENFKFFGSVYDLSNLEIERKIENLTNTFELEDILYTPVKNLSLGQRIKCEIACSLIHSPQILFLDEPTIGLDPVVKENIRTLIKRMNKEYKTTIFLTSHDIGDIEKLCKRVIIINNGTMVLDEEMEHLKYHYLDKKIIDVKMSEKVNLDDIDGIKVLKDKGYSLKLEVDIKKKKIIDALNLLDSSKIIDINHSNYSIVRLSN